MKKKEIIELAKQAEIIENDLIELLAKTTSINNINEFIDEYDIEVIMNATDIMQSISKALQKIIRGEKNV